MSKRIIIAEGNEIALFSKNAQDYISLTDIAKKVNLALPADVISNWIRNKDTIEFLEVWETLNNPDFNLVQLHEVKNEAGHNRFVISPSKWIERTNAIGLVTKAGRYGSGTFAHKDIAMAFCYWVSPAFQLYVIRDYQRLKEEEQQKLNPQWDVSRFLSKINYKIHTDAIKENLIPPKIAKNHEGIIYANEADILNKALFGLTAKEWREQNPEKQGNIRDYATIEQLIVLSNIEAMNAEMIKLQMSLSDRLERLNEIAIYQMISLSGVADIKKLT